MRAHEAGLRRYLRRLAGDEADDIAQETLLTAWQALPGWRGEGSLAGWMKSIATRKFLDRKRLERSRRSAWDGRQPTGWEAAGEVSADDRMAVEGALAGLAPRERAAALLVFAEGHSHTEAAAAMAVPLGTLKSILSRARGKLIPLLEGMAP